MPLTPVPPTDTRGLFRPITTALSSLLRDLDARAWMTPAVGAWQVRDVVAHLIDISMRRVAFHRDGHTPPPPPFPIAGAADFTRFINLINADWVGACRRLSTPQLTDLYAQSGAELSDFVETLPADAPGLFGVSWAGEMQSAGWFDIGREFTEQWHHQAQIREAVGAMPMPDSSWLRATLLIALRGLPHAYRDQSGRDGDALTIEITGEAGGAFTLEHAGGVWHLREGAAAAPRTHVVLSDDAAWRLLFNGLKPEATGKAVAMTGDAGLAAPLLRARSVIV